VSTARTIVRMQAAAKRGEVIEIRTLVGHVMETGFRRAPAGGLVPRDIVRSFTCTYNGAEVFRAELHPAISANPLISFTVRAAESGTLEFRWSGDNGFAASASAALVVT